MNSYYQIKLQKPSKEFTRYLVEHPEFAEQIPEDAQVVLLDHQGPEYNRKAMEVGAHAKKNDEAPNRSVMYIEVTEMAPIRSRLRHLHVSERPPDYGVKRQ